MTRHPNRRRKLLRIAAVLLLVPVLLLSAVVMVLHSRQDEMVQRLIGHLNSEYPGHFSLAGSHISPFAAFPAIAIDLEGLRIHETKDTSSAPVAQMADVFIGFDLWTILNGDMEISRIRLSSGRLDLVQYPDGGYNIMRALHSGEETPSAEEALHLDLKEIELEDVDISKSIPEDSLMVDAFFAEARAQFKSVNGHVHTSLETRCELSLLLAGDTTFLNHKTLELDTELDYFSEEEVLHLSPSRLLVEGAEVKAEGAIDIAHDMDLNLRFEGTKPNFDLFVALAPDELIPTLRRYENAGDVYFEAALSGPSINGHTPLINARFGCRNAYINNYKVNRKLDALNFSGFFTNGEARNTSTMEFRLEDFSARPEAGTFSGDLVIRNFDSPDINLQLRSDFQLEFLAKFLEIRNLEDFSGRVELVMNFHDIIDLSRPERSIEKLNESYFTQLKIEDLRFRLSTYDLPVEDIDLYAEMDGHEARIDYFRLKAGESDLSISGSISDLPAILHHTALPVTSALHIESRRLNLFELTGSDSLTSVNEQIDDLTLDLHFNSSARDITESPNLPVGEFFIDRLHARLNHYPHAFHDFHADVLIGKDDFRVIDFRGIIDRSDFHFSGSLSHYDLWFAPHPTGDTRLTFSLDSRHLELRDIFSYRGANYVPEDYRGEEFRNLSIRGTTDLHFRDSLHSVDLRLDHLHGRMKVHPVQLDQFSGRVHYEDEHLVVEDFSGRVGKTDFRTTLHWYLGDDVSAQKRDNLFTLSSRRLDFDELFSYMPSPQVNSSPASHDSVFNIYTLPFTHLRMRLDIGHMNYHRHVIHNLKAALRTTPDHYLHVEECHLETAGGSIDFSGYFNGSNPKRIYFSPDLKISGVDLDKLMFKFENFGQDHLVSENLHGRISGRITGKVHMHTDLVPIVDDSELKIDFTVLDGRLERFALFDYMSEYFRDKNLKSVRFDTLTNVLDLRAGVLTIPNMRVNSSLGFLDISGTQDMNLNMDYYMRIPWKLVSDAASSRLFGKKREEVDPDQVDAIQYADPEKKTRFVHVRVKGNPDNYSVTLERRKEKKN